MKGSKYIQSNTQNTYRQVKEFLEKGKEVLYTGTPCQIGGLKSYLNKEYEKLYTIDLICHGVPSAKLFNQYINWLNQKNKDEIIKFNFRNKEKGSWGLNYKYVTEGGKVKYGSANLNPYYKAFLLGNIYREVCYNCQFASINRVSDITIGDYWGIEKQHPEFTDTDGVSAMLINTEKGKELFENVKDEIEYLKTDVEKVVEKNRNLIHPTNRPKIRNYIYKNIYNKNFDDAINENFKYKAKKIDYIKFYMPKSLKTKLKKIVNRKS